MTMKLLALDCSSITIGWVLWNGAAPLARGTEDLCSACALFDRIRLARIRVTQLLHKHNPTDIAVEGPAHYTKPLAMVAQQRVMGGILLAVGDWIDSTGNQIEVIEVPPKSAKSALTGNGNADKEMMVNQALLEGYIPIPAGGEMTQAYIDQYEHEADAIGVALGYREYKQKADTKKTRKRRTR